MRWLLLALVSVLACTEKVSLAAMEGNVAYTGQRYDLRQSFATALNCPATQITWAVQEGDQAGTITTDGIFTPAKCGSPFVGSTVHVIASGCSQTASAAITVAEKFAGIDLAYAVVDPGLPSACLAADPHLITVYAGADGGVGQKVQFYSAVTFTCRVSYSPPLPASWPPPCP